MTQANNTTANPIHTAPVTKRMLIGAGIALIVISIFLIGVKHPNLQWGKFWMVKPLVVVPIAGAMGGVFYYFMDNLRYLGGWKTVLAYVISIIGYITALWLGSVLGLNGTLWN
jgi:hypothetical protein